MIICGWWQRGEIGKFIPVADWKKKNVANEYGALNRFQGRMFDVRASCYSPHLLTCHENKAISEKNKSPCWQIWKESREPIYSKISKAGIWNYFLSGQHDNYGKGSSRQRPDEGLGLHVVQLWHLREESVAPQAGQPSQRAHSAARVASEKPNGLLSPQGSGRLSVWWLFGHPNLYPPIQDKCTRSNLCRERADLKYFHFSLIFTILLGKCTISFAAI